MGLFDAFSASKGRATGYAIANEYRNARNVGMGMLANNADETRGLYGGVTDIYKGIQQQGQPSLDLYKDSIGLGGQVGQTRALNAFQQGPGYQFAQQQGEQGLMRNAAARGMLASGNTSADLMKFNQGLANQEYGNWQNRLGGLGQMYMQGATGQAGAQAGLAGALAQNTNAGVGMQLGAAGGISQGLQYADQARNNALSNMWGATMSGLNLAAKVPGMFFGAM